MVPSCCIVSIVYVFSIHMADQLSNDDLIRNLCMEYEQRKIAAGISFNSSFVKARQVVKLVDSKAESHQIVRFKPFRSIV